MHAPAQRTRLSTLQEVPPTPFSTICFSCFSRPLGQTQKTIDVLFGRYIPASPKLKKKPKNLDFWKQTWYNTKRKIRKACLQPQTGGFRQASLVTFSGCSAVGSARGLGACDRLVSRPPKARKVSVFLAFPRFSAAFMSGKKLLTTDLTTYGFDRKN